MERAGVARRCAPRSALDVGWRRARHAGGHGFAGRGAVVFEQVAGRCWKRLGAVPDRTSGPALRRLRRSRGAGQAGEQVGMPGPRHRRHTQVGGARGWWAGAAGRGSSYGRRFDVSRPATIRSDGPHHVGVLVDADHDVVDCGAGQRGRAVARRTRSFGSQAGGGEQPTSLPVRRAARPHFSLNEKASMTGDVGGGCRCGQGRGRARCERVPVIAVVDDQGRSAARWPRPLPSRGPVRRRSPRGVLDPPHHRGAGGRQGSAAVRG